MVSTEYAILKNKSTICTRSIKEAARKGNGSSVPFVCDGFGITEVICLDDKIFCYVQKRKEWIRLSHLQKSFFM